MAKLQNLILEKILYTLILDDDEKITFTIFGFWYCTVVL